MRSIDFGTAPSPVTIFAAGQQGIYSPKLFVCGKEGYPCRVRLYQLAEYQPADRSGLVRRFEDRDPRRWRDLLRHTGRQHAAQAGPVAADHLQPDPDFQRLRSAKSEPATCLPRPSWAARRFRPRPSTCTRARPIRRSGVSISSGSLAPRTPAGDRVSGYRRHSPGAERAGEQFHARNGGQAALLRADACRPRAGGAVTLLQAALAALSNDHRAGDHH